MNAPTVWILLIFNTRFNSTHLSIIEICYNVDLMKQILTRLSFSLLSRTIGGASLVAQTVKCLPTMRETWVQSLGGEDPLEKEMTTHPSILAWKIPWTEELGRLQSMGLQRVRHDWVTSLHYRWCCVNNRRHLMSDCLSICDISGNWCLMNRFLNILWSFPWCQSKFIIY